MENRKKLIVFGISTYVLAILLFNLWNYITYIIIPKNKDWEIFSYNFYASFIFYGIAMILFIILMLIIDYKRVKGILMLILIIFLVEIPAILILKESIIVSIVKSIFLENEGNYVSFIFPLALLVSYFSCKKILKISFK